MYIKTKKTCVCDIRVGGGTEYINYYITTLLLLGLFCNVYIVYYYTTTTTILLAAADYRGRNIENKKIYSLWDILLYDSIYTYIYLL